MLKKKKIEGKKNYIGDFFVYEMVTCMPYKGHTGTVKGSNTPHRLASNGVNVKLYFKKIERHESLIQQN